MPLEMGLWRVDGGEPHRLDPPGVPREQQLEDMLENLIADSEADALFDLAAVDWKGLEDAFKQGRPRTAAQRLRSLLSRVSRHLCA
jgi:hypothetical protein